ncbi:arylsulfatase [Parapedobacter soli]|uniref:arylsulfatase n=1 Tax=Parapedobacter soli TaxID=416955 RepID=UPI0021C990B2|nr:arylsulfatase [Parapedobacter soli]
MKTTIFPLLMQLLAYCCNPSFAQQGPADRPNIVIILADDMGYSDVGCYGGEIHTPNIDKLAEEGLRFRSFYNAGRCCPTRASLLTGQYPHDAGMGHMVTYADEPITPGPYQGFLRTDQPTIAEMLREAGYSTYMAGKWHVGERPQHWPRKRGFDRYFGLISGASSYYEIVDEKRRRVMVSDDDPWTPPADGFYMTNAFTDSARSFINQHYTDRNTAGRPFLLYLAYTAPHWPLHAPDSVVTKYETLYLQGWDAIHRSRFDRMEAMEVIDRRYVLPQRPTTIPEWDSVDDKKQWARKMAVYAAMVEVMDENIGKLIRQLEEEGALDNTLIIFLSDNGACAESVERRGLNDTTKQIGEPGSYTAYEAPWAYASNTPFRKYKKYMHEGGIVTPSIWHWPKGIEQPGRFTNRVGHIIDLMPTLLEAAGVNEDGNSPGTSLVPLLQGKEPRGAHERIIYWEHEGNVALRAGDWKLVKDKEDPLWALYNLADDPGESVDLSGPHAGKVQELKAILTGKLEATLP